MGIKESQYAAMFQKDDDGKLVFYPSIFMQRKGYIVPDEKTAKQIVKAVYGMIGLAFPLFFIIIHIANYFWFFVAGFLYLLVLYRVKINFVKDFPTTERKYSWKQYIQSEQQARPKKIFVLGLIATVPIGYIFTWNFYHSDYSKIGSMLGMIITFLFATYLLVVLLYKAK